MGGRGIRVGYAVAFVVIVCAPYYVQALWHWDGEGPWASTVWYFALAAFPLAGVLINRWWAVGLPVIAAVALVPLGQDPGDSDLWPYWWEFVWGLLLFGGPALLAGVVARPAIRWLRRAWAQLDGPAET